MSEEPGTASIQAPGIILGIGLGGFFDGIFLHQILQLHHMFSSIVTPDTVPGLRMNTLGDGFFHTVTWLSVLIGLGMLYSRVMHARRQVWGSAVLWGWILSGWGWFNLVVGLIDHEILGIHHVYAGANQTLWDMLFLISGLVFILAGWGIVRRARPISVTDAEG